MLTVSFQAPMHAPSQDTPAKFETESWDAAIEHARTTLAGRRIEAEKAVITRDGVTLRMFVTHRGEAIQYWSAM